MKQNLFAALEQQKNLAAQGASLSQVSCYTNKLLHIFQAAVTDYLIFIGLGFR